MMFQRLANPGRFLALSRRVRPVASLAAAVLIGWGLYLALLASPPDYQQGETVRIMYVHVPAAWMAMGIYASMAVSAFVGLVWKHVVAQFFARAAALPGAAFTLICLVTGSLWGRPMWGTWWAWDARLTSVLVLFLLYLGYMALIDAFDDETRGHDAGAMLLIAGAVNLPVIKFSVDWWNTLHQPASVVRLKGPAIDPAMMQPLLVMALGFMALGAAVILTRLETLMAKRAQAVREGLS